MSPSHFRLAGNVARLESVHTRLVQRSSSVLVRQVNTPRCGPSYARRNALSSLAAASVVKDVGGFEGLHNHTVAGSPITQPVVLPEVQCVVRARIPTPFGADMHLHLYKNNADNKEHLAMVFGKTITSRSLLAARPDDTEASRMLRGATYGIPHFTRANMTATKPSPAREVELTNEEPSVPLVRVHSECFTGETAWSNRCDCGDQLDSAARLICSSPNPNGVVIYLRQEGRGIGLANKLRAYNLQDQGADTIEANVQLGLAVDGRSYGIATSILCDLGLDGERGIDLMTNNPEKVAGIAGPLQQIKVRNVLPMKPSACKSGHAAKTVLPAELLSYLQAKVQRMGHTIDL